MAGLHFERAGTHDTSVRQRCLVAMAHGLTACRAACVERAQQRCCALAVLDAALARVARQAGVDVLQ